MFQSASKQYVINNLPTAPGDITSHTIVDGSYTISYQKVGKLYFNFNAYPTGSGESVRSLLGYGAITDHTSGLFAYTYIASTLVQLASILGVTINTAYPAGVDTNGLPTTPGQILCNSSTGQRMYYYSSGWAAAGGTGGTTAIQVIGFLAN